MFIASIYKSGQKFKKGDIFLVDTALANLLKRTHVANIYPLDIFEKYNGEKEMLVIRTGGLGDLIAMSSVVNEQTTFITQSKHFKIFDWFEHKPKVKDISKALWNTKDISLLDLTQKYQLVTGDEAIDQGSKENWYDIFSKATNTKTNGQPRLIEPTLPIEKGYCIIVSESTNQNRNADTQALIDIADKYYPHVVVAGLQEWTTEQYLNELSRADMVISTDTSAIHFREGIKRQAIGLYGAFTTESRTKYYTHTHCIDIQSPCDKQPCMSHLKNNCKHLVNGVAGCLSSSFNPDFKRQVEKALLTYNRNQENKYLN